MRQILVLFPLVLISSSTQLKQQQQKHPPIAEIIDMITSGDKAKFDQGVKLIQQTKGTRAYNYKDKKQDGYDYKGELEKFKDSDDKRKLLVQAVIKGGAVTFGQVLEFLASSDKFLQNVAKETIKNHKVAKKTVLFLKLIEIAPKINDSGMTKYIEEQLYKCTKKKFDGSIQEKVKKYQEWYIKNRANLIDEDVIAAVEDGAGYLSAIKNKDDKWEYCICGHMKGYSSTRSGLTALVVYALFKCELDLKDKTLKAGLDSLLKEKWDSAQNYDLAATILALAEALHKIKKTTTSKNEYADLLEKLAKKLEEHKQLMKKADGMKTGVKGDCYAWSYGRANTTKIGQSPHYDNSNTQFADLAFGAAHGAGVKFPKSLFDGMLNHWLYTQSKEGGWTYYDNSYSDKDKKVNYGGGTAAMTSAGIAATVICKALASSKKTTDFKNDPDVKKAVEYLEKMYPFKIESMKSQINSHNTYSHGHSFFYTAYSLERAFMLAGYETLGKYDWYMDGAEILLLLQQTDGSWMCTIDTCLALLFLQRAVPQITTH